MMKWNNQAQLFINRFIEKNKQIYIFGAGLFGRDLRDLLDLYNCFAGFIDNSSQKQSEGYLESRVYSLGEYLDLESKGLIVIAASEENIPEMKEQLSENGLLMGKDFYVYSGFTQEVFPLISFYHYSKLMIPFVQICLTERCTLKCAKCAHACYNVSKTAEDMSLSMVKESADILFEKFDIVGELVLIGGEPFLYQHLKETIEYIGEKYRRQMGVFSITTNGTVVPSLDVLEVCKKYNVLLRISNYTAAIPELRNQYEKVGSLLSVNGIAYVLGPEEFEWMDYGFEYYDRGEHADLATVFSTCRTPCREIRGNKFYYCVMARSVSDNLHLGIGQEDYFDLNTIEENNKELLLAFQQGHFEKGYLEMCRYCHGGEAKNYLIPVAEQVVR